MFRGESAIVAEGVVKRFGVVTALAGVDVDVPAGTVVGLLGPNGAGKTTLVRILSTLVALDAGRVRVLGHDVATRPRAVRQVIGLSGQYVAVDGYLTGRENLQMIGRLSGLARSSARRRAEDLLESFELIDAADRVARTYSGGMRRRLDVAASVVAWPPVLFLDEPTTGLDLPGRLGVWRLIARLTREGTTVLLTTQYLEEADRLADRIVVLDDGEVTAAGSPEELKSQIGGDRLELRVARGTDPRTLAAAMIGLGSGAPVITADDTKVVVPVANGPAILADVAARLAASGVQISDLTLRRPSLDDVFLALTRRGRRPSATDLPTAADRR
jgi:daunorubicin resistance ABC transporter ATP-binding subunit